MNLRQGIESASGRKIPNRCSVDLPIDEDQDQNILFGNSSPNMKNFNSPDRKKQTHVESVQETPQMREESGAMLGSAENPYKAAKLSPFTT